MHKLPITPAVRQEVKSYVQKLSGNQEPPQYDFKSNVKWLKDQLSNGKACIINNGKVQKAAERKPYVDYLQKIITDYDLLLSCEVGSNSWKQLEITFCSLLDEDALKQIIRYPIRNPQKKSKKKSIKEKFFEAVVRFMGYSTIQKEIFPSIMERLHIKTCVYCNAQFAIVADDTTALFQLDHCWPKSVYPYLCANFFNLQPACGSCNQRKSKTDMRTGTDREYTLSIWKSPADPVCGDMFHFHIDDANLAKYLLATSAHDKKLLEMKYTGRNQANREEKELLNMIEKRFHITDQYNKQLDIVEETVWRHQIYSKGYMRSLNNAMGNLFPDMTNQIRRLITGTYDGEDEVYRRPLSKMIHDVWNQLDGKRQS